jgi:DNA-binding transcriptional ArsR family regulator
MNIYRKSAPVDVVAFAKALADDTRQRIMTLCCCERLTVGDITAKIGVAQPTVSHHLAILREAGLVTAEHQGRETFYSLNQERLSVCCGQLMVRFAPDEKVTHTVKDALNMRH